jgi:ABC-type nitrate/sulfonate/bicarbonate transport system ATPase subunit
VSQPPGDPGKLPDPDVVAVRNVSKSFFVDGRVVPALVDIDVALADGETLSIVGPSGCGKTTLLRMIQGLETVTSGEIRIRGRAPGDPNVDAGFVFQQPLLMPWFTVRRNIEFGVRLRARRGTVPMSERSSTIESLLALVGLTDFANYKPFQLSGGMQQRVNLARALAIDPAVLLLDEPFSSLDALTRERLQLVLSESLVKLGSTAILVTHDIREAILLGDRVAVMSDRPGRIVKEIVIDEPKPRTEQFQHGTRLAGIAQDVYARLRLGEQGNDEGGRG